MTRRGCRYAPPHCGEPQPERVSGTYTSNANNPSGQPEEILSPNPKWYNSLPECTIRQAKLKVGDLFRVMTLLPIINPLAHLPSHSSGEIPPLYDSSHPLQAVSITISKYGGDVPVEWLALLGE